MGMTRAMMESKEVKLRNLAKMMTKVMVSSHASSMILA